MTSPSLKYAKKMMLIGYLGLIIGGVVFLVMAISTKNFMIGGAVAWGCGFGTTIYSAGKKGIEELESRL